MLTREAIIALLRQHYAHRAAEYASKRIGLFGSYASEQATETSDIDLVTECDRPLGLKFIELHAYFRADLWQKS